MCRGRNFRVTYSSNTALLLPPPCYLLIFLSSYEGLRSVLGPNAPISPGLLRSLRYSWNWMQTSRCPLCGHPTHSFSCPPLSVTITSKVPKQQPLRQATTPMSECDETRELICRVCTIASFISQPVLTRASVQDRAIGRPGGLLGTLEYYYYRMRAGIRWVPIQQAITPFMCPFLTVESARTRVRKLG